MKGKWKKAVSYLLTIVVTICVCFAVVAVVLRPQTLNIGTVDLNTVADGEYIGVCQNKILFAVVKVEVQDHKITDIEVVEHKASYMEQAEQIAGAVSSVQSLEVDAISGATLTSDTVLKAIENALEKDGKPSNGK
ncbi:FMN-binding protein [Roseburia hominis]